MKQPFPNLDEEMMRNLCDFFTLLHEIDLDGKNREKGNPDEIVVKRRGEEN